MTGKPEITQSMKDEARRNPNGWVYKMDWDYGPDEFVPPEAIVGAFKVDEQGNITGDFEPNARYRAVKIAIRPPRDYMVQSLGPHERNEWSVEIDPKYDAVFPDIPKEGQIGSWYIGPDNAYTGQFRPNPDYNGAIVT